MRTESGIFVNRVVKDEKNQVHAVLKPCQSNLVFRKQKTPFSLYLFVTRKTTDYSNRMLTVNKMLINRCMVRSFSW